MQKYMIVINDKSKIESALKISLNLLKNSSYADEYYNNLLDFIKSFNNKVAADFQAEMQKCKPQNVKFVIPDLVEFYKNINLEPNTEPIQLIYKVYAWVGSYEDLNRKTHELLFLNQDEAIDCYYAYINDNTFMSVRFSFEIIELSSFGGWSNLESGTLSSFIRTDIENIPKKYLENEKLKMFKRSFKHFTKRKYSELPIEEQENIKSFFELYNKLINTSKKISKKDFLEMMNITY